MPKAKSASASGSGAAATKPKRVKQAAKPKRVKMCCGAPPYALKGHAPADKGCLEGCCQFCCVKHGTWETCDVHRDDAHRDDEEDSAE